MGWTRSRGVLGVGATGDTGFVVLELAARPWRVVWGRGQAAGYNAASPVHLLAGEQASGVGH